MYWVFWMAVGVIAYVYAGYPCCLWLRAWLQPRPVRRSAFEPEISFVMVVRNEAAVLREKLDNLLGLEYPPERFHIVVVSDGSNDDTEKILSSYSSDPRVRPVLEKVPAGKACGLNAAARRTDGEIVVFTDARQKIEPRALRLLMENFVDPEVGAASGELMLGKLGEQESTRGMGMYWRVEKRVRELESAAGSVIGATGAFYAARRSLVAEVPADAILDDVFIPMNVARQGFRVVFDGRARAWDVPDLGPKWEFRRKVRTLTGNYQLLQLAAWLLTRENPLRFQFVSHKLMRLLVPVALIALALAAWWLPGPFYRMAFWVQIGFYAAGLLALTGWKLGPLSRLCDAAYTFIALNAAAVIAFANFVTGNMKVWTQPALSGEMKA